MILEGISEMAAFNPFKELGQAYEQAANSLVNNSISTLISQLTPALEVCFEFYVFTPSISSQFLRPALPKYAFQT